MILALLFGFAAAQDSSPAWEHFEKRAREAKEASSRDGVAYLVTGGLVFVGSTIAFYQHKDVFAQMVFTLGQNVGLGGIGYGVTQLLVDPEIKFLKDVIDVEGKDRKSYRENISSAYFKKRNERTNNERLVLGITHGLSGALSLYNATQVDHQQVKTVLYFLGGLNLLASLNYIFLQGEKGDVPHLAVGTDGNTHVLAARLGI